MRYATILIKPFNHADYGFLKAFIENSMPFLGKSNNGRNSLFFKGLSV